MPFSKKPIDGETHLNSVKIPKERFLLNYKAVLFDVGGTLIQAHPSVGHIYAQHARPFGFRGEPEDLSRQFHLEWKKNGGMKSLSAPDDEVRFWRALVFNVFAPFGGIKDFDGYFAILYQAFISKESWRVFEDVAESGILEKLKRRGAVLGVVSNWDSRLPLILSNMGLAHYFDFILASTVVGSAKPNEKIFHEALRLSKTKADETCHIGDEPHADFEGARNLGITSILVDRAGKHQDIHPNISSFLELA